MKKLIMLCSFGLLGTFAMANNQVERTFTTSNGYEVSITEDIAMMCCTATVTYNGEYQTHYTICGTAWNCAIAQAMAETYVEEHGG